MNNGFKSWLALAGLLLALGGIVWHLSSLISTKANAATVRQLERDIGSMVTDIAVIRTQLHTLLERTE